MTDDYKELLGKYITGKITPGTADNDISFREEQNVEGENPDSKIGSGLTKIFGVSIQNFHYTQLSSNTTDNIVIYGWFTTIQYTKYFFGVIDSNYNLLFATDKFSSGTLLNPLVVFAYDEEGRIWGIDIAGTTEENGQPTPRYRLLLLNNISTPTIYGKYEVRLRKSYYFPIGYNKIEEMPPLIYKMRDEALYYILGTDYSTSNGRIISVQINVGASNEWYQTTLNTGGVYSFDDMIVEKQEDTNTIYYTSSEGSNIKLCKWVYGSSPIVIDTINKESASKINLISSSKMIFISWETDRKRNFCYYENGDIKILDEITNTDPNLYVNTYQRVQYLNGLCFYVLAIGYTNVDVVVGCYDGNKYIREDMTIDHGFLSSNGCTIRNTYALYTISLPLHFIHGYNSLYSVKLTYYQGLYNGTQYEDYDSLVSQNVELFNENNELIFARQIYNSTFVNNTTSSVAEVPNTFLNDTTISTQKLFGQTNANLVTNNNPITKNIYEMLYINFVNSINVIDEDTNTQYYEVANNITASINATNNDNTSMENSRIGKIQINYIDGTTQMQTTDITSTGTNEYLIKATIYVSNSIESIDILSNDETQIYTTIATNDLETGKYYTLEESLRIE